MTAQLTAQKTSNLRLVAPLSGQLVPIEHVPDPVFAQKMVGDGISIDPLTQELLAPYEGEVIQLHPSSHAVTIRTPEGIELLMHIGLETVELRGQGFTPRVKLGDRVRRGDVLIEFDADYIAMHAKSLLTQVVVTNGDMVASMAHQSGLVTAGQDIFLELSLAGATGAVSEQVSGESTRSELIEVPNPTGLHARPAAVLVNLAKKYQSKIWLHRGDQRANAKSVVALLGLEVGRGDEVTLEAEGPDARDAIADLTEALRSGLGEEGAMAVAAPASIAQSALKAPPPQPRSSDPNIILGASAASGVAVGNTFRVRQQQIRVAETGATPEQERRKLEDAIAKAAL
ncbi:MAG TPA: glucose PTS transporter subunit IIA, partial [Trichocoleus sp.]